MLRFSNSPRIGTGKLGITYSSQSPYVATAFSPTNISGLQFWFKADSLALSDGNAISTWNDSGPRGANATQGSGTSQPLYKTNIKNGLPCVLFDGSNDYFNVTSASFSGMTVFCAANLSGSADNTAVLAMNTTGNDYGTGDACILTSPQSAGAGYFRIFWRGIYRDVTGYTYRTWCLHTNRVADAGGGNVTITMRYNGSQVDSNTQAASATNNPTKGVIGARLYPTVQSPYLKNYLGEYIVYNSALTDTQIASVENYLNAKWAIY